MVADNQVGTYDLEQRDWELLKDVMRVLAPFKFCQKQLEGDKKICDLQPDPSCYKYLP